MTTDWGKVVCRDIDELKKGTNADKRLAKYFITQLEKKIATNFPSRQELDVYEYDGKEYFCIAISCHSKKYGRRGVHEEIVYFDFRKGKLEVRCRSIIDQSNGTRSGFTRTHFDAVNAHMPLTQAVDLALGYLNIK